MGRDYLRTILASLGTLIPALANGGDAHLGEFHTDDI